MKLGVAYNLFDAEELLEFSAKSIRDQADYILVVYQVVSNTGKTCSPELEPLLLSLKSRGLIDELYLYEPKLNKAPGKNEQKKRNIGVKLCRKNGCTHFLLMDSDEFYEETKLQKCKEIIERENYDATACRVVNYFKEPTCQMIYKQGEYFVSFICKVPRWRKLKSKHRFPVLVDPTRRISTKHFKLFSYEEIFMHHMTLVRKNIRSKLESSSAVEIYKRNDIDAYVDYFNNWSPDQPAYPPSNRQNVVDLKSVPNLFNIQL